MPTLDYLTLDVFTDRRFCGNPLAVVLDADRLSTAQMQTVAAEFNYSETTFVLPSVTGQGPNVRIFTPRSELPFAGHPTIGTALALRRLGRLSGDRVVLEEQAGPVPVHFDGEDHASFQAPGAPTLEPAAGTLEEAASALSLPQAAILGPPQCAGAGLAFPFVQLADMAALQAARMSGAATPFANELAVFVERPGGRLAVRVFAPGHGIVEDPATGSAAAGLAVLLASRQAEQEGTYAWRIDQGVEMGRPSRIDIKAVRRAGEIAEIHVAGSAVEVARGRIQV